MRTICKLLNKWLSVSAIMVSELDTLKLTGKWIPLYSPYKVGSRTPMFLAGTGTCNPTIFVADFVRFMIVVFA